MSAPAVDLVTRGLLRTGPSWEQLHEAAEWNHAIGWEQGYRAGLDAANAAMERLIAAWTAEPHSYQVQPRPAGAKDVVGRMLRAMQRQAVGVRDRGDWTAFRAVVDHPGGPVPTWEAE